MGNNEDNLATKTPITLNEEKFQQIFNQYYTTLCSFANLYLQNPDAAADIVQDTFAKLWQIRTDFFFVHQIKSFLYTAVRNKAINELEHDKVVSDYAKALLEKNTEEDLFHDWMIEKETYRILSEAIAQLPDQTKAIMQLALKGKSNAEIARQLQVSQETVHTLKKSAYKKLRVSLKEYYYLLHSFSN